MTISKRTTLLGLLLSAFIVLLQNQQSFATHAQGADLTYECLGNGDYQINLNFYRDCAGVNAPNTVTINYSSVNCGYNLNTTLNRINNTGNEVTPICPTLATQCNGGTYPGVEEYKYSGVVSLPDFCTDWIFSFTICCRNNAINTINNPGGESIYLEALLNNLDYPCNNSPSFSNPPVPFICSGQQYCFNHGATDMDGDSLVYSLVTPATGPGTAVTYLAGYSFQQPLTSNPAVTFNGTNGDICMTPTQQEVTVMAVQVEEYRNGILVGRVVRDIQMHVVNCTNNNPVVSGIDGTNSFSASVCAGSTLNFDVFSSDPDANQNLTINWNQGIPGASFTSNGAQFPTGTFSWTPTVNDISNQPHCFTVTVSDDNCPMYGSQTFSYCITVSGIGLNVTTSPTNCGASNGSAQATTTGGTGNVTYQWSINVGNNPNANGLQAGQYWVTATDAAGCTMTDTFTVNQGPLPGNIQMNATDVACHGEATGSITANINGGQGPYTYQWSNGQTGQTNSAIPAGTYWVVVTTADGCVSSDTATVLEPAAPLAVYINSVQSPSCSNSNNGGASSIASGGTAPYNYSWNSNPVQNTQQLSGVGAGQYQVTVTDDNGCTATDVFQLNAPAPLIVDLSSLQHVSCYGGSDGAAGVLTSGGTPGYQYSWNTNPVITTSQATGLSAGGYTVTVTDNNGCNQTYSVQIQEPNPLTGGVMASNNPSCSGSADGFAVGSAQGGTVPYTYSWSGTVAGSTQNLSNIPGGWYFLDISDQNGCTLSDSVFLQDPAPVQITTSPDSIICPGDMININATASGGTGTYSYNWNNSQTGLGWQTVSPSSSFIYVVQAADANGCLSSPDSIELTVNDIHNIQFSAQGGGGICPGEQITVSASMQGGYGTYNFMWNNNIGMGQGPHSVSPGLDTYYTVTVTDVCNNSRQDSVLVVVHPDPSVAISDIDTSACGAFSLTVSNELSSISGTSYVWDIDGQSTTNPHPSIFFDQTQSMGIHVTATTTFGCTASDSAQITGTVFPQPLAQFAPNTYGVSVFNPVVSFNNSSWDSDYYSWDFGDGSMSNQENPSHEYGNEGQYTVWLVASNQYGCVDSTSEVIVVKPEFTYYIPNAFTPDGDGVNDHFFGQGEHIKTYEMMIFDRWGQLIYTSQKPGNGWDGSVNGRGQAKQDVYVYKIQIEDDMGEHHNFEGHVSLLR